MQTSGRLLVCGTSVIVVVVVVATEELSRSYRIIAVLLYTSVCWYSALPTNRTSGLGIAASERPGRITAFFRHGAAGTIAPGGRGDVSGCVGAGLGAHGHHLSGVAGR